MLTEFLIHKLLFVIMLFERVKTVIAPYGLLTAAI